jgi:hypothetical protein
MDQSMPELLTQLGEHVDSCVVSDEWERYRELVSHFYTYNQRNQRLILMQRPTATRVADESTWKRLGRHVRDNERGIAVLVATIRLDTATRPDRAESHESFGVDHVYDITQTEGVALPELLDPIISIESSRWLPRLNSIAGRLGYRVHRRPRRRLGVEGWLDTTARTITVVEGYCVANETRTMLHELAHALDLGGVEPHEHQRRSLELVAESVTYLVGRRVLDMDLTDASIRYLASWGGTAEQLAERRLRILDVARLLEEAITSQGSLPLRWRFPTAPHAPRMDPPVLVDAMRLPA